MHNFTIESACSAGQTVSYQPDSSSAEPVVTVISEVWNSTTAELENGERMPLSRLRLVKTGEQWRPVIGMEERYLLSSHGKVVSLCYRRSDRHRLLQVVKPHSYPSVNLSDGSRSMLVGLNRLVAQHFLPPPAQERFRHLMPKDGNHLNLRADNLQWVDQGEREDIVVLEHFHCCGTRNSHSKLTAELVRQIRALAAQGNSNQKLANQFGVSRPAISDIVRGVTWRTV